MSIDSKKIFGDTPTEWHERTGTNPSDYIAEGVHSYSGNAELALSGFADKVPKNAEVVVNYRVAGTANYYTISSGTALIPKGTKKSK
jgi:hypothetical protein